MTSPLFFLAIPLVFFVLGSGLIYALSRSQVKRPRYRGTADELHVIVPMLASQRETSNGFGVEPDYSHLRS